MEKLSKMEYTEWLSQRAIDPYKYTYTKDGNAYVPAQVEKKSASGKIIVPARSAYEIKIQTYTKIDDQTEAWNEREENFTKLFEEIKTAKEALKAAVTDFESSKRNSEDGQTGSPATIRDVVLQNKKVKELERAISKNRSNKRWIENRFNPSVNFIDLQDKSEKRSIELMLGFDTVTILKQAVFNEADFFEPIENESSSNENSNNSNSENNNNNSENNNNSNSENNNNNQQGGQRKLYELGVITDDTVLGLHWPIEIQVGPTRYFTAYQAILGEMANAMKDSILFESILGTRSKRTLHLLTKDLTADKVNMEIVQKVIDSLLKRDDFRELLLSTNLQNLVYAEEDEPIFGVALNKEDPNIQNPKRWRGANLWGKALQEARTTLREKTVTKDTEDLKEEDDPLMNSVITEAQQQAEKRGAIISHRRFHKSH